MAAQVLGGRVEHQVNAPLDWAKVRRTGKRGINLSSVVASKKGGGVELEHSGRKGEETGRGAGGEGRIRNQRQPTMVKAPTSAPRLGNASRSKIPSVGLAGVSKTQNQRGDWRAQDTRRQLTAAGVVTSVEKLCVRADRRCHPIDGHAFRKRHLDA